MKNIFYLFLILLCSSCVTTVPEGWNAVKIYSPHSQVSYNGGVWECDYKTFSNEPGVKKSDGSYPWKIVSGNDWTKKTQVWGPNRYLIHSF